MRALLISLAATVLFLTAHAAPPRAVRCGTPPVIDGKLDDACWKDALKFTKFKVMNKGLHENLWVMGRRIHQNPSPVKRQSGITAPAGRYYSVCSFDSRRNLM